jgi:hypothetical protein
MTPRAFAPKGQTAMVVLSAHRVVMNEIVPESTRGRDQANLAPRTRRR